jgi:hypothetical protein
MAFGFGSVALLSFMRLRFAWWPVHPVIMLVAFTYPILCMWPGFFFGWMIKLAVIKFGGGKVYNKLKPFMVGIIAGELTWVFLYFLFGLVYHSITGLPPKAYYIFPG